MSRRTHRYILINILWFIAVMPSTISQVIETHINNDLQYDITSTVYSLTVLPMQGFLCRMKYLTLEMRDVTMLRSAIEFQCM